VKRSKFWGIGALAFAVLFIAPPAKAEPVAYDVAVKSASGTTVRLHATETGTGSPLLLLHGMGGSSYSFRHIVGPLSQSHRVITLDLKGFGQSEKPFDAAYRPIDQAELVAAFLRQRRLSGVTLAGHSFGGAVAMLTTLLVNRSEPWRIKRLVLMNTPAFAQPLPRAQRFLTLPVIPYVALAVVPPLLNTRAALDVGRRAAPRSTDTDAIAYAEPLYDAAGRHALIATTRAVTDPESLAFVPYYGTIRQPTLLIWCRNDPTVPLANGERLAKTLPHARLSVIEQCQHMPPEEHPVATHTLIRAFARGR
jgi:pimeloyl-ACP methyl ester carboxylesterase